MECRVLLDTPIKCGPRMRVTNFGATWYRPDVIVGEPRIRCVLNAHPVRIFGTGEGNCDTALQSGQGQQGTSELSHSSKEGEASEDP
jgi:hypothetical protein